jgi:hypothetical protein
MFVSGPGYKFSVSLFFGPFSSQSFGDCTVHYGVRATVTNVGTVFSFISGLNPNESEDVLLLQDTFAGNSLVTSFEASQCDMRGEVSGSIETPERFSSGNLIFHTFNVSAPTAGSTTFSNDACDGIAARKDSVEASWVTDTSQSYSVENVACRWDVEILAP